MNIFRVQMIVELELIIDQLSVFDCHSFPELL